MLRVNCPQLFSTIIAIKARAVKAKAPCLKAIKIETNLSPAKKRSDMYEIADLKS
jgi:hypothetical protein